MRTIFLQCHPYLLFLPLKYLGSFCSREYIAFSIRGDNFFTTLSTWARWASNSCSEGHFSRAPFKQPAETKIYFVYYHKFSVHSFFFFFSPSFLNSFAASPGDSHSPHSQHFLKQDLPWNLLSNPMYQILFYLSSVSSGVVSRYLTAEHYATAIRSQTII